MTPHKEHGDMLSLFFREKRFLFFLCETQELFCGLENVILTSINICWEVSAECGIESTDFVLKCQ